MSKHTDMSETPQLLSDQPRVQPVDSGPPRVSHRETGPSTCAQGPAGRLDREANTAGHAGRDDGDVHQEGARASSRDDIYKFVKWVWLEITLKQGPEAPCLPLA